MATEGPRSAAWRARMGGGRRRGYMAREACYRGNDAEAGLNLDCAEEKSTAAGEGHDSGGGESRKYGLLPPVTHDSSPRHHPKNPPATTELIRENRGSRKSRTGNVRPRGT